MNTSKFSALIKYSRRYIGSNTHVGTFRYGGKIVTHPKLPKRNKIIEESTPNPSRPFDKISATVGQTDSSWKTNKVSLVSVVQSFLHRALRIISVKTVNMSAEVTDAEVVKTRDLSPPDSVRGMKVLNRDDFFKTVYVPGLSVDVKNIGMVSKDLKDVSLRIPGVKPWAELDDTNPDFSTHKVCLLDPGKFEGPESLTDSQKENLDKCDISLNSSIKLYKLELCYRNWTYHEILKALLPEDSDGVAGFSIIGHIIHLNLRDAIVEYKNIIGEVLLDKIPSARTVINKLDIIDNTFRNFQMELLAGEDNFVTVTKEHGLAYKLDFSKVYWNPRLGTEHQRVVNSLSVKDIVYDVFAGIGPFSVPAAKKGCTVIANDLNPESYHWLKHNLTSNKVLGDFMIHNLDGREFIRTVVKEDLLKRWSDDCGAREPGLYHIVMNLPALAVEFLDAFQGLFRGTSISDEWKCFCYPKVHCYTFSKSEDVESDVRERVETALGAPLPADSEIRFVRDVAPGKNMMCAVFTLQHDVLFTNTALHHGNESENSPPSKRAKTDVDGAV